MLALLPAILEFGARSWFGWMDRARCLATSSIIKCFGVHASCHSGKGVKTGPDPNAYIKVHCPNSKRGRVGGSGEHGQTYTYGVGMELRCGL